MTRAEVVAWLRAHGFAVEADRVEAGAGLARWQAAVPGLAWRTTASSTLYADAPAGRIGTYCTPSGVWCLWARVSGWRGRVYGATPEEARDSLVAALRRYLSRPATPRTERRHAAVRALLDVVGGA